MSKAKFAKDIGLRIVQELADLGIKPNFLGKFSNVKKAFTGGKPTFFKPDVLETFRAQDGNFSDALNLMEEESKYIVNATDAEKMAFLNNLSQYKSLGGPPRTTKSSGIASTNAMEQFKKTQSELQKALKDLQSTTEKNKNQALKDLDDFMETGGQPLKAKDNKFLGGSMHEEGQIRTGVRQFLQTEFKNGRLKLDELDKERVMQYSPMIEHDPILVFKKIYGDDAYNKAGSFPGAFEKGENFKHYEQIFRKNMGDDVLKVKNEKYKGDGTLVLTKQEEVFKPTPDDDDIPFAEGGIAGYYTGGMVDVEPSLSDIGHGSDSLMSRTRLVSPGSQSTTSTGLNYLLAEDNDNIRVPFSKGKLADAARRKFMKTAGAAGAGIAALKTGLLGLGEKAAPVVETAVETAKGVPSYFFQLVDVIKSKGREIRSYGDRVKQYIAPSKDGKSELMLTEDLSTGDIQVKKIYKEGDDMVTKSEEMNFTKGQGDESTKGIPADDYEEVTEFNSRIYKDEFNDPDVVEGINVEEIVKEIDVKKTKKADGGRIGFNKGKAVLGFLEIIKDPKKIKEAVENIFKSGDYKYDAEMAAESLVELNPKAFGNKLYEDLDDKTRMEIYGAVLPEVRGGSKIKPYDKTTETQFNKDVEEAGGMEKFLDDNPISDTSTKRVFKGVEIKDPTFDETLPFDNDAEKLAEIKMSNEAYDMEIAQSKKLAPQMTERMELKAKYPGITDSLLDDIIGDPDPNNKARALAALDEAMTLQKTGKSETEIIEILKSTPKKEMASGGLTSMLGE
jgi:hypothetical protein